MATYKEFLVQKAKLEEQPESMRVKELEAVIQQVREIVTEQEERELFRADVVGLCFSRLHDKAYVSLAFD